MMNGKYPNNDVVKSNGNEGASGVPQQKTECHCSRTSRYHTQDSCFENHSVNRCWTDMNVSENETPEHLLTVLQAYLEDDLNETRFPLALEYLESWIKYRSGLIEKSLLSQSNKNTLEEAIERIKELRHEIQQSGITLGNEQWKEGHTKCLEEVLSTLQELKGKK